ncbi:MAG: iron-containing alcohol dehydrogenase [Planctomycetaceae bacterium]|nr:iron-containing alcohol dehydrogenase [Planctomycetaceae bacterium]
MRTTWTFHSAGQLVFGRDAVAKLSEIAPRLGTGRIYLISDAALMRAGVVDRVRQALEAGGSTVEVFDGGLPEPAMSLAESCAVEARRCKVQAVVGLGGGSNMDLAKIVATVLAHGKTPRDYVGDDQIPGPILPLICIPTTAGTGSEVSGATVLTDTEKEMKVGVLSNYLRPRVALVDSLLTVSCPRKVTADSGIDALTHAIEAYTAVDNEEFPLPEGERTIYQGRHLLGDVLAERAIRLIGANLRRVVENGHDLEAREAMALGATLAGLAFSNVGVAAVHALEYPIGGATHCSHGAGNGLLLPFVMRFNLPARVSRFAQIAEFLGENIAGLGEPAAAERAIAAVERLKTDIGIPQRLRDLGVTEEQLPVFAEKSFAVKRILRVNPRPVTVGDLEGILRSAW